MSNDASDTSLTLFVSVEDEMLPMRLTQPRSQKCAHHPERPLHSRARQMVDVQERWDRLPQTGVHTEHWSSIRQLLIAELLWLAGPIYNMNASDELGWEWTPQPKNKTASVVNLYKSIFQHIRPSCPWYVELSFVFSWYCGWFYYCIFYDYNIQCHSILTVVPLFLDAGPVTIQFDLQHMFQLDNLIMSFKVK